MPSRTRPPVAALRTWTPLERIGALASMIERARLFSLSAQAHACHETQDSIAYHNLAVMVTAHLDDLQWGRSRNIARI